MKYKKWCFGLVGLMLFGLLCIAGVNYFVDPFGYFSFQGGDYSKLDFRIGDGYYRRVMKAEHVQNFNDQYDAYIIGGSKTGSVFTESLQKIDGYRYYNMFEMGGTTGEYLQWTEFVLENASPKKIVICLSGGEPRRLEYKQEAAVNLMPAVVTGESQLVEYADYLLKDVKIGLGQLWDEIKNGKESNTFNYPHGERYLKTRYKSCAKDREKFTKKKVLKNFKKHMKQLFTSPRKLPYFEECLDDMRAIKELCDANGVELQVIMAPSFIGEKAEHDSEYFRDYMQQLAVITDYWDFSGYCDINMNPYNYFDEGHFYYEVADLMIDIMAGETTYEGFGTYVTKENAAEVVRQREADYNELKAEYDATGTIALPGLDDSSWIYNEEYWDF